MNKVRVRINRVEDMKRFIINSSKVAEPGVNVYHGNLVIDGSSVIAMMNLVGNDISVEYPKTALNFKTFITSFLI